MLARFHKIGPLVYRNVAESTKIWEKLIQARTMQPYVSSKFYYIQFGCKIHKNRKRVKKVTKVPNMRVNATRKAGNRVK